MTSYEDILLKLEEYDRTKPLEIPEELEDFVGKVANTGDPVFPWNKIKLVYRTKLTSAITKYVEEFPVTDIPDFSFETMKSTILDKFDSFESAPFTIQRLSELLINHFRIYKRIDKFMRAVQKILFVTSSVEPGGPKRIIPNGLMESMDEELDLVKRMDEELELVNSILAPRELPKGDAGVNEYTGHDENRDKFLFEAEMVNETKNTTEGISPVDIDRNDKKSDANKLCNDTTMVVANSTEVNNVTVDIFVSDVKDPDFIAEVIVDQCSDESITVDDQIYDSDRVNMLETDLVSSISKNDSFLASNAVAVVKEDGSNHYSDDMDGSEEEDCEEKKYGGLFPSTDNTAKQFSDESKPFDSLKANTSSEAEETSAVNVQVNLQEPNEKQVLCEDIGDHVDHDTCLPRNLPFIETRSKSGQ